jgi:acyl-CoA synthetase (AMP-forming)/AMP-acid ligase II
LSLARDEISITVNNFGAHPRIGDLSPDFHILADPAYWNPGDESNAYNGILSDLGFLDARHTRLVMPLRAASGEFGNGGRVFEKWSPLYFSYDGNPSDPIDFSRPVPTWGQNVLNIALMLCLHLQAKEVFLVGFDNAGILTPEVAKGYGHFYAEEPSATAISVQGKELENCLYGFVRQIHAISRKARESRMPIFTCSREGSFRMFPFLEYDSLFDSASISAKRTPDPAKPPSGAVATVHARILERCRKDSGAPALHLLENGSWRTVDRRTLADKIETYRGCFQSMKRPGELVLFLKRTDLDLLAAYIGAMAAGMIPAQMSPPTSKVAPEEYERRLSHILETTGARIVFADTDAVLPLPVERVSVITADCIQTRSPGADPSPPECGEIALAQFSSGTTGLQKAVFLRHEGILAHMRAYAPAIGLVPSDTVVSWLPLYHDMGLIAGFLMPLMEGLPLVLMDPFAWIARPELFGEAAERFGGTLAFLPNFAYHVLARSGRHSGVERLRLLVNCSEPARPETHRKFLEAFPGVDASRLSVCYAMAENTFAVSQTTPGTVSKTIVAGGRSLLSCGPPVPGTEVRIRDADADGIGEVMIRGSCLFARFLDGVDRMVDGFYPTGDLGLVADGEIYVAGRKKDLLIVRGKNIHPQDVEYVAGNCPGVRSGRTVCFGVDSVDGGSEEMVVLVEPDGTVATSDLTRNVGAVVEDEVGLLPRRVQVVPAGSLVKTSSGKASRSRNRELFLQDNWRNSPC